jgi:Zn-dependent M28 family amino/carboxypeptidase
MNKHFIAFLILFSANIFGQSKVPNSVLKHIQGIDSNRIKAHVTYLSNDKLMGRLPGTPGFQMGVDYIVGQMKAFGLQPKGDNDTYLQKVLLRTSVTQKETASAKINLPNGSTKELLYGEHLVIYPNPQRKSVDIDAPMVFVGAGFNSLKFGLDDYKNIDVKGKVVVIMKRAPENVSENVKRHLTYADTYQAMAQKNGAIGVLICDFTQSATRFKGLANYMANTGSKEAVGPNGVVGFNDDFQFYGNITVAALKEIMKTETNDFDQIWQKIEKGQKVSMPMKSRLKAHYESTHTDIESCNIVGMIEGTDDKLKSQYVVHSGHIDHIGVTEPIKGDSINNGAHDNASGTASSLEIARMYATLEVKPKRSILFVLVTAEEMGLLGSAYFMAYPTVPKQNIVADINTDMPTIIAPLESVAPLGAEHSSMMKVVAEAAKLMNLKSEIDPDPAEGRFVRSDQYNFMKAGVPAIHIKYGYKYSNPALNLFEKVKIFRENHYHKPSDEVNDSFNWSAGRQYAQVNFLVSYIVAQSKKRPYFLRKDFFNPKNHNL